MSNEVVKAELKVYFINYSVEWVPCTVLSINGDIAKVEYAVGGIMQPPFHCSLGSLRNIHSETLGE